MKQKLPTVNTTVSYKRPNNENVDRIKRENLNHINTITMQNDYRRENDSYCV